MKTYKCTWTVEASIDAQNKQEAREKMADVIVELGPVVEDIVVEVEKRKWT